MTAEFAAVGVTTMLEAIRAGRSADSLLPGIVERDLRRAARDTPDRGHATRAADAVRRCQGVRALHPGSYRRATGSSRVCGILYNHESPRRPVDFLPRKVASSAAAISLGSERELALGDLDSRRDWGYAGDEVRAMWLMLQQDEPGDYVIATGEVTRSRSWSSVAFPTSASMA